MPSLIRFLLVSAEKENLFRKKGPAADSRRSFCKYNFKYDQSLSLRQAMPGRTLPSRYSSDAPPPVEIWVTLSANPN